MTHNINDYKYEFIFNSKMISKNLISGKHRREVKKRIAELNQFVKMFWLYEDIDRVYGAGMPDEECNTIIEKAKQDIMDLEASLNIKL